MRSLGRVAIVVVAAFLILAAVVLVRTVTYKPPGLADLRGVKVGPPIQVDVAQAAQHLSQAVQIQTVSHQDAADDQLGEWDKLHAFLQTAYPAAHAAMTRQIVAGTSPASAPRFSSVVIASLPRGP